MEKLESAFKIIALVVFVVASLLGVSLVQKHFRILKEEKRVAEAEALKLKGVLVAERESAAKLKARAQQLEVDVDALSDVIGDLTVTSTNTMVGEGSITIDVDCPDTPPNLEGDGQTPRPSRLSVTLDLGFILDEVRVETEEGNTVAAGLLSIYDKKDWVKIGEAKMENLDVTKIEEKIRKALGPRAPTLALLDPAPHDYAGEWLLGFGPGHNILGGETLGVTSVITPEFKFWRLRGRGGLAAWAGGGDVGGAVMLYVPLSSGN